MHNKMLFTVLVGGALGTGGVFAGQASRPGAAPARTATLVLHTAQGVNTRPPVSPLPGARRYGNVAGGKDVAEPQRLAEEDRPGRRG